MRRTLLAGIGATMGLFALALYGTWGGPVHAGARDLATGEVEGFVVHDAPQAVPAGEFTDAGGGTLSFADFRGKVVLVNFWATWCGPCREEMPALDRLQGALGGRDFQVVAISTDRQGASVAQPFLDEIGAKNLALYLDQRGSLARALGLRGLPATLLLDGEGREVGRMFGPAEWDSHDALRLIRYFIDRLEPSPTKATDAGNARTAS
ncbi:TlpA family protein disulfide reductase [Futiania mangrovi]|uniref:TlpA family protein disulfide reductase n=1 Tax=Futiania mangrovi TaxID=2959716 RepID=A0A9J6PAZ3_9PROT|nr:TlpA disulfide reductase family protein [Futiania mangrovii]MCP1336317.1 TlpA family protein disulfide reductase [Futiania mangrovii]